MSIWLHSCCPHLELLVITLTTWLTELKTELLDPWCSIYGRTIVIRFVSHSWLCTIVQHGSKLRLEWSDSQTNRTHVYTYTTTVPCCHKGARNTQASRPLQHTCHWPRPHLQRNAPAIVESRLVPKEIKLSYFYCIVSFKDFLLYRTWSCKSSAISMLFDYVFMITCITLFHILMS